MKLIVTRHGETVENAAGIIQGHLEGTLSKAGKTQAQKLAQRLKDEKIDAIYSSDLTRAVDTAKEIATYHKGIPLFLVKELRERKHGNFQGKRRSEIDANPEEVSQFKSITTAPPNGENWFQVYGRARLFLDKITNAYPNQNILVVSHGGLVRAMICVIKKQPPEEMFTIDKIGNASIGIFELEEGKEHQIHVLNCTKHLE